MRKKIFSVILTLVLTIGTCSIAAAADRGSATRNSLKSYGAIEYHKGNDKVIINSEDLYMLADQIDQVKLEVTDQLEAINTYFTAGDGISLDTDRYISVTHTRPSRTDFVDPVSVNFDTLLEGIAASQSVSTDVTAYGFSPGTKLYKGSDGKLTTNASAEGAEQISVSAATADNLSAGTVAWVNGSPILGTGGDNKAYNESGYKKGEEASSGGGDNNNEDFAYAISNLHQVGGYLNDHDGNLPYTFTPGKSVLLIFEGFPAYYTGTTNAPDAVFDVGLAHIRYWKNNPDEKIPFKVFPSGNVNCRLYLSEW